eukprot:COSAG02_NODE_3821_length_6188_cov_3.353917_1_plen_72_part_00
MCIKTHSHSAPAQPGHCMGLSGSGCGMGAAARRRAGAPPSDAYARGHDTTAVLRTAVYLRYVRVRSSAVDG